MLKALSHTFQLSLLTLFISHFIFNPSWVLFNDVTLSFVSALIIFIFPWVCEEQMPVSMKMPFLNFPLLQQEALRRK